jgi:3-(3-hydroxy-phenyl)propionate hydroxylase
VGICAALELARRQIPSVVVDKNPSPPTDLRASTFHPPTLEMLEPLGLTAAMLAEGLEVPEWQIRMHASHERAVFDLAVLAQDTRYPFRLQYEQASFCALGWAQLMNSPLVELRTATEITGLDQDSAAVRLQTADGQVITSPWVIATDGAASTLRGALKLTFEGLTYPETTVLATTRFPFEAHLPGLSWVNYVWTDTGTFSLLRVPDRWRVSLYPEAGESIDEALRPARIETRLQAIVPNKASYDVLECRPYRIHQRILDSYRHGRILFAGDAAHLNSPSGGMGMNCGIHDAMNLAEKLSRVLAGAPDSLLDQYDRQRRPIARDEILGQADANRRRMQQKDPAWRRAELERLQAISSQPAESREFLLRSAMITGLRRAAEIQ